MDIDKKSGRGEHEEKRAECVEIGAWRPNERLLAAPLLDGRHWLLLPVLATLGEEFLRLRGLGGLDLPKQNGELFWDDLVAAQQRFKRVHQEHLNANELGKDVHLHLLLTGAFQAMQEHTAHPVAEC